ncbi:RNA polymerase sigma factor [Enterococcus faecalis]
MLVIRLYKCTGKEVPEIDGWKRKKQIRALETLVDTKYEKMYRIAFNYTHSKEDALDVIQESFEKALKAIQKGPDIKDFDAWFFRILLSVATDYWRKKKREAVHIEKDEHVLALLNNPQRSFLEIEEIINQLDSPNREIILLKFFEGFTLKEIALILDINENTIKTKMYRSLNELRSLLN